MHLAVAPVALVLFGGGAFDSSIGHGALAVPPIILPIALILVAIGVCVGAAAMHFAVAPLALILVAVRIPQRALAVDLAIDPLALIPAK